MDKLILRNKILTWAVIVLFLMNLGTIAALVWNTNKLKNLEKPPIDIPFPHKKGFKMSDFIKEELKFNPQQCILFDTIDSMYRNKTGQLFEQMHLLRVQMMQEITSKNPDSAKLYSLARQLGDNHVIMKLNTFRLYFDMAKICNAQQKEQLKEMFRKMIEFEGRPMIGKGKEDMPPYGKERKGAFINKDRRNHPYADTPCNRREVRRYRNQ